MPSSIVVKGIQLSARCGITGEERQNPQPLLVDLIFRCQNQKAFQTDALADTVDYALVTTRIREIGESRPFALLETLTEQICQALFREFPVTQVKIWVRKIRPPLKGINGSVGIQMVRSSHHPTCHGHDIPSPFLVSQLSRLPQGKVLDVAAGRGRHALYLASHGYAVHGIDRDAEALHRLQMLAQQSGGLSVTTECVDLEANPQTPPDLGTAVYDVILVFFYLYRPLLPQLIQALKPGGVILYETFLMENHLHRHHPRRKEFCLEPNELLSLLHGLRILHYDEGDHETASGTERAFTARVLARHLSH